jgi:hypothetical protein
MADEGAQAPRRPWNSLFSKKPRREEGSSTDNEATPKNPLWNMGMLNDKHTIEVPGSVLLLAKDHNEPLGLRNTPARTSHSSLPTARYHEPPPPAEQSKKMTKDGQMILDPQPDDSHNDPLNWASWRRDCALLSLGLFCMVGGGMTSILAAGFTDVAHDYDVEVEQVALTTGLYMMGLGIGCVLFSPTAILYGKRPVYLFGALVFILTSIWCALSPSYTSLLLARIFQGIAVSPVECLPSATIAEIFFLHERAFRIGIYTLLLLGGKNLVPLISAVIIEGLNWRWVFWIVAIVVGFCGTLLFFFVPETFWDRSPVPRDRTKPKRPRMFSRKPSHAPPTPAVHEKKENPVLLPAGDPEKVEAQAHAHEEADIAPATPNHSRQKHAHVGFAPEVEAEAEKKAETAPVAPQADSAGDSLAVPTQSHPGSHSGTPGAVSPQGPHSAYQHSGSYFPEQGSATTSRTPSIHPGHGTMSPDVEAGSISNMAGITTGQIYTHTLRKAPPKSFAQQLKVYHGRLNQDKWWKAALRPLILFAYPAVLWSSVIYACSIGWLIVISESVAMIYRNGHYKFNALQTGLVYISPFVGGILGTAVAGKVSDVIVKAMARRNGGLYEPEFRLVMAIPIALTTVIGLMGFGWSAEAGDAWIVPTVFFGIISFGCCVGSTTSITFCVDSYRQYAGEALVTLNFSKNVFHGLVFSLFVTDWLSHDGAKMVFIWLGVIQLITLLFTIPMYIYGKRARMWTVRKNLMEHF